MKAYWKLNTNGDPLPALSDFLQALWVSEKLDAMVVAPDGHGYLLRSPEEILLTNPFHPMMKANLACLVVDALKRQAGQRIGAIVRACEMRALNEYVAHGLINLDSIVTICVDCLGTYAVGEVRWREERLGLSTNITDEVLRFAPQGGIAAYRYRPACQVCLNPGATDAMINIGVLGLPVRKVILVQCDTDQYKIESLLDGFADEDSISKREKALEKIAERHQRTRKLMSESLESGLPGDIDAWIQQFETCGTCNVCLEVCPICSMEYLHRTKDGSLIKEDVINWLSSCSGCGMCEQACPKEYPLTAIFNRIRHHLDIVM